MITTMTLRFCNYPPVPATLMLRNCIERGMHCVVWIVSVHYIGTVVALNEIDHYGHSWQQLAIQYIECANIPSSGVGSWPSAQIGHSGI